MDPGSPFKVHTRLLGRGKAACRRHDLEVGSVGGLRLGSIGEQTLEKPSGWAPGAVETRRVGERAGCKSCRLHSQCPH